MELEDEPFVELYVPVLVEHRAQQPRTPGDQGRVPLLRLFDPPPPNKVRASAGESLVPSIRGQAPAEFSTTRFMRLPRLEGRRAFPTQAPTLELINFQDLVHQGGNDGRGKVPKPYVETVFHEFIQKWLINPTMSNPSIGYSWPSAFNSDFLNEAPGALG